MGFPFRAPFAWFGFVEEACAGEPFDPATDPLGNNGCGDCAAKCAAASDEAPGTACGIARVGREAELVTDCAALAAAAVAIAEAFVLLFLLFVGFVLFEEALLPGAARLD